MKPNNNTVRAQQQSLRPSRRWLQESQASRARTLGLTDQIIPWPELIALVRPYFASDQQKRQGGRTGFSLEMLIRIYVIALLWQCSYRSLQWAIEDSASLAAFVGTPIACRSPRTT